MDRQHTDDHWDDTLMGRAFWADATAHDQRRTTSMRQDLVNQALHMQFPFNQSPVHQSAICAETKARKDQQTELTHRRGVSVQDIPKLRVRTGLRRNATVTPTMSNSSLSQSYLSVPTPTKSTSPWSPISSRFSLPSAPWSPKKSRFSADGPASLSPTRPLPPLSPSPSPRQVQFTEEQPLGSPKSPYYKNFEDGPSWRDVPLNIESLKLDLFVPFSEDDRESHFLDIEDMKPLLNFRNLRSLHITCMVKSYQPYIWQAVWLNPYLEELELEMATGPQLHDQSPETWKAINEDWKMGKETEGYPVYYGNGNGELFRELGEGEYLDKFAIEKAKIRAGIMQELSSPLLPIKRLTLSGFVVDAGPFLQWFDPQKLRSIYFKGHCVDSGFWVPSPMQHVSLRVAKDIDLTPMAVGLFKIDVKREVKVVDASHQVASLNTSLFRLDSRRHGITVRGDAESGMFSESDWATVVTAQTASSRL